MAWSYSGNPSESVRDEVRFLLGDTDESDQILSDEELDYLVDTYTDAHLAASEAARSAAAKFSRLADKTIGDLQIKLSQKATHYANLATVIGGGVGGVGVVPEPTAGGLDDDPFFERRSMDFCDAYDLRAGDFIG